MMYVNLLWIWGLFNRVLGYAELIAALILVVKAESYSNFNSIMSSAFIEYPPMFYFFLGLVLLMLFCMSYRSRK